ncbi:MAG TPA: putative metal-binding motif-containing protein [Myxococcota bacterium]|nr:putative metal-binding motif-containing protein [Myxococcota bacterium]
MSLGTRVRWWVPGCIAWIAASCSGGGGVPGTDAVGDTGGTPEDVREEVQPEDPGSRELPELVFVDYGSPDPGGADDSVLDETDAATDEQSAEIIEEVTGDPGDSGEIPGDIGVDPAPDQGPNPFETTCSQDPDCESGWCLLTDQGRRCSRECRGSDCPEGWSCRPALAPGGVAIFLCIPDLVGFCSPCSSDFDCRIGRFPSSVLRCVLVGDREGAFCLPGCASALDCPAGTECRPAWNGDESVCQPSSGTCTCSPRALEAGATGRCLNANAAGTCAGERRCTPQGLTECDAPVPDRESCNGRDDDCNGRTDEEGARDCRTFWFDLDGDGAAVEDAAGRCLCAPEGLYRALQRGDCDDRNPGTHPGARESCNGRDDNCDGVVDEDGAAGCFLRYPDRDRDGFGDSRGGRCTCSAQGDLTASIGGDCDDQDPLVWSGSQEVCNGRDDNCDGLTDEDDAVGCTVYYRDSDGDGHGDQGASICACAPRGAFTSTRIGDCNDTDPEVFPGAPERCDRGDDDCNGVIDDEGAAGCASWYLDVDGDGYGQDLSARCLCGALDLWRAPLGGDCNDASIAVSPGARESCNGLDDDCNGVVDEEGAADCRLWYQDGDRDLYGNPLTAACLCGASGDRTTDQGGDCNDQDPTFHPGAPDVCGNGLDEDCDGTPDQTGCSGCSNFYRDLDGDGFGTETACLSDPDPSGGWTARVGGDCDDGNPQRNPGAPEACNGIDDDCDGLTDEEGATECQVFYRDQDFDGYGALYSGRCLCGATGLYSTTRGGDCDDGNRRVHPGQTEECNLVDDNCDGVLDEEGASGCALWYRDLDGDSYGDEASARCLCRAAGAWTVSRGGDCDDANVSVRPLATEKCNGRDDDCDGLTDEVGSVGCQPWYRDLDQDGYGVDGTARCLCGPDEVNRAPFPGDCADDDSRRNPAVAEQCDGVDNNCDGQTDEEMSVGCTYYYRDEDGDGWGTDFGTKCLCAPDGMLRALRPGDCDDRDAGRNPGLPEVCGGGDENCNGQVDEAGAQACRLYRIDSDRDGYGVDGTEQCLCGPTTLRTALLGGDCNDGDPLVNPAIREVCNGKDDNCNGQVDEPGAEGCLTWYRDQDRDGFGTIDTATCLCVPVPPFDSRIAGDCDDGNRAIFPGSVESCNGIDDDCNGLTDEGTPQGCVVYFRDRDGDTYGDPADFQCRCAPGGGYVVSRGLDCNDQSAAVHPGAPEVCNGIDDDCDEVTDPDGSPGCQERYLDADRDTWGSMVAGKQCRCQVGAPWDATRGGDCDDGNATVFPGAPEVCDGLDDDCDGNTDPEGANGCSTFFEDKDGDGYGISASYKCLCYATGVFRATRALDCDDNRKTVYPGAREACNGRDDNCDGNTDEEGAAGCTLYYLDGDRDGYGKASDSRCLCAAFQNWDALSADDCCDADARARPNQTEWFTQKNYCNSWDYDCDGTVQVQWTRTGGCIGGWPDCQADPGWYGAVPSCGAQGQWVSGGCDNGFLSCKDPKTTSKVQPCH